MNDYSIKKKIHNNSYSIGYTLNNIKHGLWKTYENDKILIECNYENGTLNGEYIEWNSDGEMLMHIYYKNGSINMKK